MDIYQEITSIIKELDQTKIKLSTVLEVIKQNTQNNMDLKVDLPLTGNDYLVNPTLKKHLLEKLLEYGPTTQIPQKYLAKDLTLSLVEVRIIITKLYESKILRKYGSMSKLNDLSILQIELETAKTEAQVETDYLEFQNLTDEKKEAVKKESKEQEKSDTNITELKKPTVKNKHVNKVNKKVLEKEKLQLEMEKLHQNMYLKVKGQLRLTKLETELNYKG